MPRLVALLLAAAATAASAESGLPSWTVWTRSMAPRRRSQSPRPRSPRRPRRPRRSRRRPPKKRRPRPRRSRSPSRGSRRIITHYQRSISPRGRRRGHLAPARIEREVARSRTKGLAPGNPRSFGGASAAGPTPSRPRARPLGEWGVIGGRRIWQRSSEGSFETRYHIQAKLRSYLQLAACKTLGQPGASQQTSRLIHGATGPRSLRG